MTKINPDPRTDYPCRIYPMMLRGIRDLCEWTGLQDAKLAEVGSYLGCSARLFYQSARFSSITCIDPWTGGYDASDAVSVQLAKDGASAFAEFLSRTAHIHCLRVLRLSSIEAAREFADGSLDMVYIDAEHTYRALKADIAAWRPKLRAGGILAGHDYWSNREFPGINDCVDEVLGGPHARFVDGSWAARV